MAKAAVQREREQRMAKDQQTALSDWQTSQAFRDALSLVTRFPQLDRLDEQRLQARMKKSSTAGDSMSEYQRRHDGAKVGSKTNQASPKASLGVPVEQQQQQVHRSESHDSQDL
eukprot:UN3603